MPISKKELSELVDARILSPEKSSEIENYFSSKKTSPLNRILLIFSSIGSLLIGSGIILIFAHNWDEFSKSTKTILAFLPMLIAQGLCIYVIVKKSDKKYWIEGGSAFLFCTVGASMALISQIYNLGGELEIFIMIWMLIFIPVVYILNSSFGSLLYIAGITWHGIVGDYNHPSYTYWLLLILILPHYYSLFKKQIQGNFIVIHNWFLCISIPVIMAPLLFRNEIVFLVYPAFMSILTGYIYIGKYFQKIHSKLALNPFLLLGTVGIIILLFTLSFNLYWEGLMSDIVWSKALQYMEFWFVVIILTLGTFLVTNTIRKKGLTQTPVLDFSLWIFIVCFITALQESSIGIVIINLFILMLSIQYIRKGAIEFQLGKLNFGLLLLCLLITFRFFDIDFSFIVRGIFFILIGISFILTNYIMIKKKKALTE